MTKVITEETLFQGPTSFTQLPREFVGTLRGATPSVLNVRVFKCYGAVVTVTDFLFGAEGQQITILGDGTTTISYNTKIRTNTGADKLLLANNVYRFTYLNNIWVEDADVTTSAVTPTASTLDRSDIAFSSSAQVARTINVLGQAQKLDGTAYLTDLVDVMIVVSDSAADREPSSSATLSLGAHGSMFAGSGTATGVYRTDINGQLDIVVTEANNAYRYIWVVAGGNTRLFVKAKFGVFQIQFT